MPRKLSNLWICEDCIGDHIVKRQSRSLHSEESCCSCKKKISIGLTPKRAANFIKNHLPQHFDLDFGLYPGYELTLTDIVRSSIGCECEIFITAIAGYLEDPKTDNDENFYWPGQRYWHQKNPFDSHEHEQWYALSTWNQIAHELAHNQRFFNTKAYDFFNELIKEALQNKNHTPPDTPNPITILEKDRIIHRARIARNMSEAKTFKQNPATALNAPPKELATNNRMSPAGVPLLYASREVETCIAEVRPSLGDLLAIGHFRTTRRLKFFDFTSLETAFNNTSLSIFDPNYHIRTKRLLLLKHLHTEISRPIQATETEYVVTQAITEFIQHNTKQGFDGIIFRSSQNKDGINYVLFEDNKTTNTPPHQSQKFPLAIDAHSVSFHLIKDVHYESAFFEEFTP